MCHNGRVVSRGCITSRPQDGFEVGFCRPAFVKREMEVEVDVVFRPPP